MRTHTKDGRRLPPASPRRRCGAAIRRHQALGAVLICGPNQSQPIRRGPAVWKQEKGSLFQDRTLGRSDADEHGGGGAPGAPLGAFFLLPAGSGSLLQR